MYYTIRTHFVKLPQWFLSQLPVIVLQVQCISHHPPPVRIAVVKAYIGWLWFCNQKVVIKFSALKIEDIRTKVVMNDIIYKLF